ncbi:CGP-CTERM sorting domain-containing protein, partial [Thermococcus sp.]
KYGDYEIKFNPIIDSSNSTLPADLQRIVEKACKPDRAIVFVFHDRKEPWIKALYDPNGQLYAKGISAYHRTKYKVNGREVKKTEYAPAVPCPDRNRPGYWTIVFSDGTSVRFYVPEKTHAFSVQAICGPGILALLSLLPIGMLRRKNHKT